MYAKYSIDNDKLKFNKTDGSELDKNPTTNTESLPNSGNKINRTLTTSDKTITDQWKIPTMEVKEKTSKKAEKSNFVTIFVLKEIMIQEGQLLMEQRVAI